MELDVVVPTYFFELLEVLLGVLEVDLQLIRRVFGVEVSPVFAL